MEKLFIRGIMLIIFLGGYGVANAVIISDTEFAPVNWNATVLNSTGGATQSVSQISTGGNSGAYREMIHTLPPLSSISVIHQFLGASYDPSSQGAIDSIDYTEDHIQFNPPFQGAAIGAVAALLQDGNWFFGPNMTFTDLSWQTVSLSGLTASNFLTNGMLPDFSDMGGVISFGFARSNSNTGNQIEYTTTSGIDNWSFTVNSQSPSTVPEPAAILLFGAGLIGLSGVRKRHK